jgi:hypothetical protein
VSKSDEDYAAWKNAREKLQQVSSQPPNGWSPVTGMTKRPRARVAVLTAGAKLGGQQVLARENGRPVGDEVAAAAVLNRRIYVLSVCLRRA